MELLAMNVSEESATGWYVYAFIEGDLPSNLSVHGIDDEALKVVRQGSIGAVCSAFSQTSVSPRRPYLAAHSRVMQALLPAAAVLPLSFGTLVSSQTSLQSLLAINRQALQEALRRVKNKVEMSIKLKPVSGRDLFSLILERHPDIRTFRDEVYALPEHARQTQKIELGRRFDQALTHERQRVSAQLQAGLGPLCDDLQINVPLHVRSLLDASCLIGREAATSFDQSLSAITDRFDDDLSFEISGPWVPYHFSAVPLQMDEHDVHS